MIPLYKLMAAIPQIATWLIWDSGGGNKGINPQVPTEDSGTCCLSSRCGGGILRRATFPASFFFPAWLASQRGPGSRDFRTHVLAASTKSRAEAYGGHLSSSLPSARKPNCLQAGSRIMASDLENALELSAQHVLCLTTIEGERALHSLA